MNTSPAISVDQVVKSYATVRAVRELSFLVPSGEIFALLGPNGAGKTTMVRMLVGILRPDAGTIAFPAVAARAGSNGSPRNVLGYLPEERGLHRETPVLRTLEYFGVLNGLSRSEAREAAHLGLERFGLKDRSRERIDSLSKGNQQKVQFLAATLHRPSIAVLDEPFSGLDPVNQEVFIAEIRRLRDEGSTILLSAHQMDLVESMADRLLLMNRGEAVLQGTLEEIRSTTGSGVRLQIGVAPGADTNLEAIRAVEGVDFAETLADEHLDLRLHPDVPVGRVLHELTARLPIVSVHTAQESLRQIFLRTVREETSNGVSESAAKGGTP